MKPYERHEHKSDTEIEIGTVYQDDIDEAEEEQEIWNEYLSKKAVDVAESLFFDESYANDDGIEEICTVLDMDKLEIVLKKEPELENHLFQRLIALRNDRVRRVYIDIGQALMYFKDLNRTSQDALVQIDGYIPMSAMLDAIKKITSVKFLTYCKDNIKQLSIDIVVKNAKKLGFNSGSLKEYIIENTVNSDEVLIQYSSHFPSIDRRSFLINFLSKPENTYNGPTVLASYIRSFATEYFNLSDVIDVVVTQGSWSDHCVDDFLAKLCTEHQLTPTEILCVFNVIKDKDLSKYKNALFALIGSSGHSILGQTREMFTVRPDSRELISEAYHSAGTFMSLAEDLSDESIISLVEYAPTVVADNFESIKTSKGLEIDIESIKASLVNKLDYKSLVKHKNIIFTDKSDREVFDFIRAILKDDVSKTLELCRDVLERKLDLSELSPEHFEFILALLPKIGLNPFYISKSFLNSFNGLNKKHAALMVGQLPPTFVFDNLDKFDGLKLDDEFALLLMRQNPKLLYANISRFKPTLFIKLLIKYSVHTIHGMSIDQIENTDTLPQEEELNPAMLDMWRFFDDDSIPRRIRQSVEVKGAIEQILTFGTTDSYIENNHLLIIDSRRRTGLSPNEIIFLLRRGIDVKQKKPEDWVEILTQEEGLIEDEGIRHCLKNAASMFGPEAVLHYMNRPDLSRHDALHFVPDMIDVCTRNGVESKMFVDNILSHVLADNSVYEEGTAHHKLAAVIQGIKYTEVEKVLAAVQEYENIPQLQILAQDFKENSPFASWKLLKKFHELVQMLNKTDLLRELAESKDISDSLRKYVSELMFHPNINGDAVRMFWKDPAEFLDVNDVHTPQMLNEVKKPSNLISLPHLGLSAEGLRDAYIEGSYDRIQTLPPMEKEFYFGFPTKEQIHSPKLLFIALWRAIGQKRMRVPGVATNPDKLFAESKKWCDKNSISWSELWNEENGSNVLTQCSSEQQNQLIDLIFDNNFGVRGLQEDFQIYRVTIGNKSDPNMVIAGNDTASCMPFGSGKNNVYMFNPNCVQLVVQRQNSEGKWKTAAQSVLNIDHQVEALVPELMRQYLQEGVRLKDLVKEGDLERCPVIVCDNIEVAKNEEGARSARIKAAYEKFFGEYLQKHGANLGVKTSEVYVGTGYTPTTLGFKTVENHFVPQAPMGYSDNMGDISYVIETNIPDSKYQPVGGLSPMRVRDALAVSVVEGKAYKDNETLLENLHHMQNSIIGMEVSNIHFGRPNLSFVYRDTKGAPKGYILAYEGSVSNTDDQVNFVYLSDLATDGSSKMAGGRLISAFFDKYTASYGREKKLLPIYTNAREATSFPIIQRQAEDMCREQGLLCKVVEIGLQQRAQDTFHNVVICIGRTEDELLEQEMIMKKVV